MAPARTGLVCKSLGLELLPQPFPRTPVELPDEIGDKADDEPLVKELNREDFLDFKALVDSTPAGPLQMFTCHRLVIQWNSAGIDAIEAGLLKWLRTVKPPSLKSERRRPRHLIVEDELAQLSAWRAERAGLSCADYRELTKGAQTPSKKSGGFVRQYDDNRAFRKAAERALERIKELQRTLRPNGAYLIPLTIDRLFGLSEGLSLPV